MIDALGNSTTTTDVPITFKDAAREVLIDVLIDVLGNSTTTTDVPITFENAAREVQNMAGAHMMNGSLPDGEADDDDTMLGVGLLMDLMNGEQDADVETLKRAAELLAQSDLDSDEDDGGKSFFGLNDENYGQKEQTKNFRVQPRSRSDNEWMNWKNNGLSMP